MLSIPVDMVRFEVVDQEIVPQYFSAADVPWLRDLILTFDAMVDTTRDQAAARLVHPPGGRLFGIACHVLWQVYIPRVRAPVAPRHVRSALFVAAAGAAPGTARRAALRRAADALGLDPDELLETLFADLPGERRLSEPTEPLGPEALVLTCNTAIAQALLRRAVSVVLNLAGNTRPALRLARLLGLICTVAPTRGPTTEGRTVHISGPLSLLAHTTAYGRALAALLPGLPWCRAFRLTARCALGSDRTQPARLVLTHRSPIRPGPEPRQFDSALEERFAKDLIRATSVWQLRREPEPVPAGTKLLFPDFELRHVDHPERRWWLEIVGFWTPDYLATKLADLRAAGLTRLIMCIDRRRACAKSAVPTDARLVWFERRIDVAQVLSVLDT